MNSEQLKQFVQNNPKDVSMRECAGYPGLYVLKYKRSVFYDDSWNEYLEHCRGTVIDAEWNIVSYPFTKIYNYGIEARAPKLDPNTMVHAWRKVNGFMAAVTWHSGQLLVSTTGSLDSDYVRMAREMMDIERFSTVCQARSSYTFMFEVVHPSDPHIIPEKPGLYLLGYRAKVWGSSVLPDYKTMRELELEFGTIPVEYYNLSLSALIDLVKSVKHEGFVFYSDSGVSSKIKSTHYLVNKWVSRNPRTDKIMRADFKNSIDEEYHVLVDLIRENIEHYTGLDEQQRLAWIREKMEW
jgi:hypothetical protein